MIYRVMERAGATVWSQIEMCNVVVQSVLLYGSKIWVVTGEMLKVLTVFHHWTARRMTGMTGMMGMTGMTAKRRAGREWEYPPVEEAMDAAGIHPIGVYIKRQHTTIMDRVA